MASTGRVSVLVSTELQTLLSAARELPKDVNAQTRKHTKQAATPVWDESVQAHTASRLQTVVLSETARVAVSDSNVRLLSGGVGSMPDGTPKHVIARGAEHGASHNAVRNVRSKRGKIFPRHTKRQFPLPRAGGYTVYPAARDAIPRLIALWVQTARRTVHEAFEKVSG